MDSEKNDLENNSLGGQNLSDALNLPNSSSPQFNSIRSRTCSTSKQAEFLSWKNRAEFGDSEAQFQKGECFKNGYGTEQSFQSAFFYFKLAADQGHSKAQISLAVLYKQGLGIEKSSEKAFYYYQLAADQNESEALYSLAECFLEGIGTERSQEKALEHYRLAALAGYSFGFKHLAERLTKIGIPAGEIASFLTSIFSQDIKIKSNQLYSLASLFECGDFIGKSPSKAVHFYKFAAELGCDSANYRLKDIFLEGQLEMQKNEELAIHYFLACKNPSGSSLIDLAKQYEEKCPERAFYFYQQVFKKNPRNVAEHLGRCFEEGIGCKPCLEKAIEFFRISYERKSKQFCYDLGRCFEKIGSEEAIKQAFDYYQEGAERSFRICQYHLARCYFEGKGVSQSLQKAKDLLLNLAKDSFWFDLANMLADILEEFCQINEHHQQTIPLGKRFEELAKIIQEDDPSMICLEIAEKLNCLEDPHQQFRLAINYHLKAKQPGDFEKPFKLFKKAADNGNQNAQYALGRYYQLGNGCKQSWEEAIKYYTLAANQGNAQANYELGCCFQQGLGGITRSYQEAFKHFQLAADQGYPDAQSQVGEAYEKGRGIIQNSELALKYHQLAAEQHYAPSQNNLGRYFENGKGVDQSNQKAFHYYQKAADQGLKIAQYNLGRCFKYGMGVNQSNEKAFYYFGLAAFQGYPEAQYLTGKAYIEGLGVSKDSELGFRFLKIAADQGLAIAQDKLGKCFKYGIGIKQSNKKAFYYFRLAGEQGHPGALYHIGQAFIEGLEVSKDNKLAFKYLKLAADQGNKRIQYLVAKYFEQIGNDIEGAEENAIYYFQKAANQGHLESIKRLFECYHYGKIVDESQEEALKYLKMGVEAGIAECEYQLGLYYKFGRGSLKKSLVESFKYFKLAAKQGHSMALRAISPRILHPSAKEANIQPYLIDHQLSTLESILKSYGKEPVFFEILNLSWEEALVIRDAMIENPRLTLMCSKYEIERLVLAFEFIGYHDDDLNSRLLVNPSTLQETYGCVFIGNDIKDTQLNIPSMEDDPS